MKSLEEVTRERNAARYVMSFAKGGPEAKPFMLEALEGMIEDEEDNTKAAHLISMKVMYEGLMDTWRGEIGG